MTLRQFESMELGTKVRHVHNHALVLFVTEICCDEKVLNTWREKSNNPHIRVVYKFEANKDGGGYHTWAGNHNNWNLEEPFED